MKVRIGISPGRSGVDLESLDQLCAAIAAHHFDSLWLSEVLTSESLDPLIALGVAAARHENLKIGTTMLAPGRNAVRLAKSLATLDRLSNGRLLVTFVPGLIDAPESSVIGVVPKERGAVMDELLPLLRELLTGEPVSYSGRLGEFDAVRIRPLPVQDPLEFWMGGIAKASLVRCGRLADGWLPSLCAPEVAVAGRDVINAAANDADREISPEHFGLSVPYALRDDDATRRAIAARRVSTIPVPLGAAALRTTLEQFIEVGFSKFVLRPLGSVAEWSAELGELSDAVGALQS
jgi:probable F420-dependent oxidoreductase